MANEFVNKVKTKDGSEYEIHDARMPVPTPEDDEKIVGVNVQGKYVLKPAPSEGMKLYKHTLVVDSKTFEIVSLRNTEYTNWSQVCRQTDGNILSMFQIVDSTKHYQVITCFEYAGGSDNAGVLLGNSRNAPTFTAFSNYTISSDTVTEL